jgi:DNA-3-methyladenine glycosylase II
MQSQCRCNPHFVRPLPQASYLQSLAVHHDAGTVTAAAVTALADDAAITALTQVKGIGVWTAHMFLMFQLGRPDVLPVGDLGVRQGMRAAYGLKAPPGPEEMEAVAERWRPYRSVGAWYMWRALEGAQVMNKGNGSSTNRIKQSKA